jgi:hypothetical protein
LAFCRAFDSMAFCEGCLDPRLLSEDTVPELSFPAWERFLEWPLPDAFSSSSLCRLEGLFVENLPANVAAAVEGSSGDRPCGVLLDCEKSLGVESSQFLLK